jgi:hypothetical protein
MRGTSIYSLKAATQFDPIGPMVSISFTEYVRSKNYAKHRACSSKGLKVETSLCSEAQIEVFESF